MKEGRMTVNARLGAALLFVSTVSFAQTLPKPNHIVLVFEENKSFADVMNGTNAPYILSLAAQGASLKMMFAFHHPSQPNYIEFFAGTNTVQMPGGTKHTFCDDTCVTTQSTTESLGGAFLKKNLRFTGYAENLKLAPAGKPLVCSDNCFYRLKHCPWIDFADVPLGNSSDFSKFASDLTANNLPTFAFVTPNLIGDMHSPQGPAKCSTGPDNVPVEIANGDAWLKKNLDAYVKWAMNNNSLLIVTWDESSQESTEGTNNCKRFAPPKNQIPTIFVGPMVKSGFGSNITYNPYDLLRTIEDMYGLDHIGNSTTAKRITDIWK
jgi:acid phosphatase